MLILSALLFSISSNLDNLVIGIAYGIKKINIGILPNCIIAFITSLGTLISMLFGSYIAKFLPTSISNSLGALIIIALGIYFIITSLLKFRNKTSSKELALKDVNDMVQYAESSDLDKSGDISIKESLLVALGLTFNNLGTGVAASITGVSIKFTVISTFVLSIIIILLGESIGNRVLGKILGKYAPLFSGVLLIILGILELLN